MPGCTVTHIGIWDAASSGNLLFYGAVSASKTVTAGDTISLAAGSLDITFSLVQWLQIFRALDTATQQPSPSSTTDMDATGYEHDVVHANHSGAIIALETKLGLTDSNASSGAILVGSGASTTVDYHAFY